MSDDIVGQTVEFNFADTTLLRGVVEYVPAAPGDCFIIRDTAGKKYYIQQFAWMKVIT